MPVRGGGGSRHRSGCGTVAVRPGTGQAAEKIQRVYVRGAPEPQPDVDAALYEGLLKDEDKARCESFNRALAADRWVDLDFRDGRLKTLAARLKARSFPSRQDAEENHEWRCWVRDKLGAGDAPWLALSRYESDVAEMLASATGRRRELLVALRAHGEELRTAYGL